MGQMSAAVPSETAPCRPGPRVNRRTVLGTAAAAAAAAGAFGAFGVGTLEGLVGRIRDGGGRDWISPLGEEGAQVGHLLRRATLGGTAAEYQRAVAEGFSATVERLLEQTPASPPELWAPDDPDRGSRLELSRLQSWWVDQMLSTATPLVERMTLFWHGHFTSDYQKVGLETPFLYWQNLTWRQMALSDLPTMLWRVTVDPAMLRYLDLGTSTAASPNENYSRELMEVFTLGVGHYTEMDVRASARALAGWVEPRPDRFRELALASGVIRRLGVWDGPRTGVLVRRRAYPGTVTFLGRPVSGTRGVLDAILAHPATAEFIATKLAQEFIVPEPSSGLVARLADAFRSSGYDVRALLRAVFSSPEFLADSSYRSLVKSPTEFAISALKALGASQLGRLVVEAGPAMGQALFDPPDVGGWPPNGNWISSSTVIGRVNFVTAVLDRLPSLPPIEQALAQIDGVLSPQTAELLNRSADDRRRWFIVLASPEFQLK
jgi:uncharacterized protein (DUF1800 family)